MWTEIASGAGIAIAGVTFVLARMDKTHERAENDGADAERWRIQLALNERISTTLEGLGKQVARIEGRLGVKE